jgi:hypothetical protein
MEIERDQRAEAIRRRHEADDMAGNFVRSSVSKVGPYQNGGKVVPGYLAVCADCGFKRFISMDDARPDGGIIDHLHRSWSWRLCGEVWVCKNCVRERRERVDGYDSE